jgi:hypothetical protein
MGATTFITTARGTDTLDAYDVAVAQAQHDHGHGGYTGTIAEKDGFIVVESPQGVDGVYLVDAIDDCESGPSERLIDLLGPVEAKRVFGIYDDKWGPAVAVQTEVDEWTFLGWASC